MRYIVINIVVLASVISIEVSDGSAADRALAWLNRSFGVFVLTHTILIIPIVHRICGSIILNNFRFLVKHQQRGCWLVANRRHSTGHVVVLRDEFLACWMLLSPG
jgi:hypothetical protein